MVLKMKRLIFCFSFLMLVTGCSSASLLSEPYEVRYFNTKISLSYQRYKEDKQKQNLNCPDIKLVPKADIFLSGFARFLIPNQSALYDDYYNHTIIKNKPYYIISEWNDNIILTDNAHLFELQKYVIQIPKASIEKCTMNIEKYIKIRNEKTIAEKNSKKESSRKKAKKEALKKHKAEQEANKKNDYVIKKYGKPYCEPFKIIEEEGQIYDYTEQKFVIEKKYEIKGGAFSGKQKNCLFEKSFYINQATSNGLLVYDKQNVCIGYYPYEHCYDKNEGPYFIITNENDREMVDGDNINGLFEYIGTYSYTAISGATRTVMKFKHIE